MIETRYFNGTEHATKEQTVLAERVNKLKKQGIIIKMGSIFLKSDKGSVSYTTIKKNRATDIGIGFDDYGVDDKNLPQIIDQIQKWNEDPSFQGILVQKPSGIGGFSDEEWDEIVSKIDPKKDIDGLVYWNLGHLLGTKDPPFLPATVRAVLEIMKEANFDSRGKNVVIIGSSIIMGLPLSIILIRQKATVSVLNDETEDISPYTEKSHLIVTATGGHPIITKDNVKDGVVIIDVSSPVGDLKLNEDGRPEVDGIASFVTTGKGAVGPVTVKCLLENLVDSVEKTFFDIPK